jgi:hypothetical protein
MSKPSVFGKNRRGWLLALVVPILGLPAAAWQFDRFGRSPLGNPATGVANLASGFSATLVGVAPERVSALVVDHRNGKKAPLLFVGGGRRGGIYRMAAFPSYNLATIAAGMGNDPQFGTAGVCVLAFRDLFGDKSPELIALTSQVQPIGQPRVYIWSTDKGPAKLLAVGIPAIESSWPHGVGFGIDEKSGRETVISAYCGHGEIMEYRLSDSAAMSRFSTPSYAGLGLEGRLVDQLPASGEQAATGLLGYGISRRLIVALGYKKNSAAIRIYGRQKDPSRWTLEREIAEDGRFGNVRFLLFDPDNDGRKEIAAWWCTDLASGRAEMIVYSLERSGRMTRRLVATGDAEELWPSDNQAAYADSDGDGRREVWFATPQGDVRRWRCDEIANGSIGFADIETIAQLADGAGPLCVGPDPTQEGREVVYVGSNDRVIRISNSSRPADFTTVRLAH